MTINDVRRAQWKSTVTPKGMPVGKKTNIRPKTKSGIRQKDTPTRTQRVIAP
jgi:hypothetical protein